MLARIPFIIALLLIPLLAFSQGSADAFRYSFWQVGGTARTLGVGGAMGALGADFSVVATNPAGIASFRRSEGLLSPSFMFRNTRAGLPDDLEGNQLSANQSQFALQSLGVVFASRHSRSRPSYVNFAVGMVRLADFNEQTRYEGRTLGSIVNRWEDRANRGIFDDFETNPAIDAGALYLDPADSTRWTSDQAQAMGSSIFKRNHITRSGSINEISLNISANVNNRLFLGATMGFPLLEYQSERIYQEVDDPLIAADTVPFFDSLEFRENLEASGAGINLKLGLIYRVSQAFRVGLAFHTPTAFSIEDSYATSLRYDYTFQNQSTRGEAVSPEGLFEYNLSTPWRLIGSVAFLAGKRGFVTGEVEYLDYRKASFGFEGFPEDEAAADAEVDRDLKSSLIARIGGELVLAEVFRLRAGFNYQQNPRSGDTKAILGWSAGAGYRHRIFYADLAFRQRRHESSYPIYQLSEGSMYNPVFVDQTTTTNEVILTAGVKF